MPKIPESKLRRITHLEPTVVRAELTPWQEHVTRWSAGCGSCLCSRAANVCLARGQVPADVLFVGQAPGQSEDARGIVFDGPAGALLDKIVARSVPQGVTTCFTNLIGCIPLDENGDEEDAPDDASVRQCSQRLRELAWICDPKLIVCVGDLARDWLDTKLHGHVRLHPLCSVCLKRQRRCKSGWTCDDGHGGANGVQIPRVAVHHPARILRSTTAAQGSMRTNCQTVIMCAVEKFVQGVEDAAHS